jgi:hypothetical protein
VDQVGWVTIAVGGVLFTVGATIRFGRAFPWLGDHDRAVRPRAGDLRRWAGTGLLGLGVVAALAGVSEVAQRRFLGGILWVVFLLGVIALASGSRRRYRA